MSTRADNTGQEPLPRTLNECLSIDLEVDINTARINALAAWRPDTGEQLTTRSGPPDAGELSSLDRMAQGARFVLGHNLIAFDVPHLQAAYPGLGLLGLPRLDTLLLNPLAFPRRPYHRLVKHYKDAGLLRRTRNDPLLDSQLAHEALAGQYREFGKASPEALAIWHWLSSVAHGDAFDEFFALRRDAQRPAREQGQEVLRRYLTERACRTSGEEAVLQAESNPWATAYAVTWMEAAGTGSAIPPWVLLNHPETQELSTRLRDNPCRDSACQWCKEHNNPEQEFRRWSGHPGFRAEPRAADGASLQGQIVARAMNGDDLLGIMPTGGGKSLCYQVPALSRYEKTSALTVVISPLVALMADQVAGLENRGITNVVAINGLLSMPERRDALDRVRLGDAAIVLISPEQLRSRPTRTALEQRLIGAWVLDEAHCLSKWGHDFRPDYRYIGKFIRRHSGAGRPAPVLCLTATAKPEVKEEIREYFRQTNAIELEILDGGARRSNLDFDVVKAEAGTKMGLLKDLVESHTGDGDGRAIIYCSTRSQAENVAEFLSANGLETRFFHAAMTPDRKMEVQNAFISGNLRVISATNAFGMGIDKDNVRAVVHNSIPGSLENYLQEAGRAGRDGKLAHCILVFHEEDVETQHTLLARNRLRQEDIQSVLDSLRRMQEKNARRTGPGEADTIVATAGEIVAHLDDEDDGQIAAEVADTKVRTAVAWLEESELAERLDNQTTIYPSTLRIGRMDDIRDILNHQRGLEPRYIQQLINIAQRLLNADPALGITTDELAAHTGMPPEHVAKALGDLETLGITNNNLRITAYVHVGVARPSGRRYEQAAQMEEDLITLMQEQAPDQGTGETLPLQLRETAQELRNRGNEQALTLLVLRILRSVGQGGTERSAGTPNLKVRNHRNETVSVTLNTGWSTVVETSANRRKAARHVLTHLLAQVRGQRGADLLADTTLGDLTRVLREAQTVPPGADVDRLLQQALLWLHDQEVIRLNQGMAVLRPAMTIKLNGEKRPFGPEDYEPLDLHYGEQTQQIHIMEEYAERGLQRIEDAIAMAEDYFAMPQQQFIAKWLAHKAGTLKLQTTPQHYSRIVEQLNNPVQRRIVTDSRRNPNVLVLAGPGSGKTRVLVHRIAYLVKMRRERPESIIALAYNRHAAAEIRRRLRDLIGNEAHGVTVLTCHALAMRLTGRTYQNSSAENDREADRVFRQILLEATRYLEGEGEDPEDADELREKLLAGFGWLFVDEYQDINEDTYNLISALAGRSRRETGKRLNLFAVGDDDQNIYAFSGSSTGYIRKFEEDYSARPQPMLENYRSTRHIIEAANAVIDAAQDRLKVDHAITIDRVRTMEVPGGSWQGKDPVGQGRVQVIPAGRGDAGQAHRALDELLRLSELDPGWDWTRCAVVARQWDTLEVMRAVCRERGLETQLAQEDFTASWQLRETQELLAWIDAQEHGVTAREALERVKAMPRNRWSKLLAEAMETMEDETGCDRVPAASAREWIAEWARENRRRQHALLLTTAHRAKGLEFDNVVILDGNWQHRNRDEAEEQRRLYYVAMTRARHTLTLMDAGNGNLFFRSLAGHASVLFREPPQHAGAREQEPMEIRRRFALRDVDLSFPGRASGERVANAIAELQPGDPLTIDPASQPWGLRTPAGVLVGRLSRRGQRALPYVPTGAAVLAIAAWDASKSTPEYRKGLRRERWEVVVPELIFVQRH